MARRLAIGALPQNAYRTAQQLDKMSQMVLEYAFNNNQGTGAVREQPL
jgi:hypothetical protein